MKPKGTGWKTGKVETRKEKAAKDMCGADRPESLDLQDQSCLPEEMKRGYFTASSTMFSLDQELLSFKEVIILSTPSRHVHSVVGQVPQRSTHLWRRPRTEGRDSRRAGLGHVCMQQSLQHRWEVTGSRGCEESS